MKQLSSIYQMHSQLDIHKYCLDTFKYRFYNNTIITSCLLSKTLPKAIEATYIYSTHRHYIG